MKKLNILAALILLISTATTVFAQTENKLSPGELYAASGFDNIVPLHWVKSGNPTEYHVFRSENGGEFQQIAVVSTGSFDSQNFIDENVTAGTEYSYIIKDENDNGITNQSSAVPNNSGFSLTIPGWNTTTPTIDGTISAGEWDDAVQIDITNNARIYTENYWQQTTYAYLKVANDKLYIAVKDYNNPTLEQNDQIIILFDYNNDNLWTPADHDQRYYATWLSGGEGDVLTERGEISGTYPNTTWGTSEFTPPEFNAWIEEGAGYVAYETSFDISGSYLEGHTDNFALLLQTSVYENGESEGMSGLYSPAGIWKAPATFLNCSVQFDADTDAPVCNSAEGLTTLVNNDLQITLNISDLSAIQTVEGHYSIDGGSTETVIFAPSKNNYGYTATIPAQNSEISGTLEIYMEDVHGNNQTTDAYNIEWITDTQAPEIEIVSAPEIATHGNIPLVSASVTDDLAGVEEVVLYYEYIITSGGKNTISMTNVGELYSAQLPDEPQGTMMAYYIEATDNEGNITTSDYVQIEWYEGGWFGVTEGEFTANNFGNSADGMQFGVVLQLGDFEGKINKLAYMVPDYCQTNWTWKIVEIDASDLNNVVWTDKVLVPEQTYNGELVYNASFWTEIDVQTDELLTGDVGLVVEMQPNSYWGRDAESTQGISWFFNTSASQWQKMGTDPYQDFGGDWTLKAHLYNDEGVGIEKIVGTQISAYNYPNPCSEFTNINFKTATDGNVKIEITNINGKQIGTIQNSNLKAGNYTVNYNTSSLNSGVYFYSVISGDKKITKKFVVER